MDAPEQNRVVKTCTITGLFTDNLWKGRQVHPIAVRAAKMLGDKIGHPASSLCLRGRLKWIFNDLKKQSKGKDIATPEKYFDFLQKYFDDLSNWTKES